MSHVAFKIIPVTCQYEQAPYVMSLIFILMSLGSMSHVNFKKRLRRHVKFKHQGSYCVGSQTLSVKGGSRVQTRGWLAMGWGRAEWGGVEEWVADCRED